MPRVHSDNEIFIRRHRVHAGLRRDEIPIQLWDSLNEQIFHCLDFERADRAVDYPGCTYVIAAMNRYFHAAAFSVDGWKTIKNP